MSKGKNTSRYICQLCQQELVGYGRAQEHEHKNWGHSTRFDYDPKDLPEDVKLK